MSKGKASSGQNEKSATSKSVDFSYLGDKKIKKGKEDFLQQTQDWKGGSHKERREEEAESKRVIKKAVAGTRKAAEKGSWKKQFGGAAALFGICGVGLMQFLMAISSMLVGNGMTNVDVMDTPKLKEVLFGGQPWLVHCVNNETVNQQIPKVLEESTSVLWSNLGIQTAVVKCWDNTASGRSIVQRFKLKKSPPLAFLVANGNNPRAVSFIGASKPEDLEKKLKPAIKLDAVRIAQLNQWIKQCTSRKTCIVLGHKQSAQKDTALNVLKPIMEKYRTARLVTLDTSFWQLKLEDKLLATRPAKEGKSADVLCLARDQGEGIDGITTFSGRFLQEIDAGTAGGFLAACEKREGLVSIDAPPKIWARPTKAKKVQAPPIVQPKASKSPSPPPASAKAKDKGNVDRVGSRAKMEQEDEALFEAVDEEEDGFEQGGEDDEGEGEDDEVEL